MMEIDTQLYECADIEGANRWQKSRSTTLPGVAPVVSILIILELGRLFVADFGLFYNLTLQSAQLLPTTDVINWFTFRALFSLNDYSMGAAVGLIQSVIGLVLVLTTNHVARSISDGEQGLM